MRLLVSVRDAIEAAAALAGGADIVDAKDPAAGPLGAVAIDVFAALHAAVGGRTSVSAAIGDAADETVVAARAEQFVTAGAAFVKIGFAGVGDARRVEQLIAAAVRAGGDVIAVAYADAEQVGSIAPAALIDLAAWSGARGVLLDTAVKTGPGVRDLTSARALAAWVRAARHAGLLTAIAGRLTARDLPLVSDIGADIAGVRGAACIGGRTGRISADKVRHLHERIAHGDHPGASEAALPLPVAPGND